MRGNLFREKGSPAPLPKSSLTKKEGQRHMKLVGATIGRPFLYFLDVFLDFLRQILYNKRKKESSFAVWYFPR